MYKHPSHFSAGRSWGVASGDEVLGLELSSLPSGKNKGLATQRPRKAGFFFWVPSLSLFYAFTSVDGHFSSHHSIQACPDVGHALCCALACSPAQTRASLFRGHLLPGPSLVPGLLLNILLTCYCPPHTLACHLSLQEDRGYCGFLSFLHQQHLEELTAHSRVQ